MALQKSALKAIECHGCRKWLLRSVITGMGYRTTTPANPPLRHQRPFVATARRWNDPVKSTSRDQRSLDEINNTLSSLEEPNSRSEPQSSETQTDIPTAPTPTYIPWYLQSDHQPSAPPQGSPLAARQSVPDLPAHPPAILQPLLDRVSIDLGMDDLTLLDLRAIDPPPALGANLIMIIGTARSEKHLHVSADRLCRWLRSEYGLSPYADGLLGRNELKLKLRRRAKRSRLLSAVGAKAPADTEIEDGIRTGWVCVNLGRVEGGELPESEKKLQRREGLVGFGASVSGCAVVVQMLTEQKRGEVDLERLWSGILDRARKDEENAAEAGGPELEKMSQAGRTTVSSNGVPVAQLSDEHRRSQQLGA